MSSLVSAFTAVKSPPEKARIEAPSGAVTVSRAAAI
jgi:hypothetical protein